MKEIEMRLFGRASIVVPIVLGLLLTACGNNSPREVTITLTDFKIEASQTGFEAGVPYRFVVTNSGAINHEFMIMPSLTQDQMGMGMSMGEMDEMAVAMIEEDELPPGATKTIEITFQEPAPAGTLEFACHVEGHYEAGMKLPITVK